MQSSDRRYLSFHRCCSSRRHNEAVQLRALCYTPLTTISNSVLLTTPPNPAISELKQTPSIEDLGNRHILAYSWSSYFFWSADGLKQSDLAAIAEVTPLRRVLKAYRASCKDNTISAPFPQVTYDTSGSSSLCSTQLQDKADTASVKEEVKVWWKQSGRIFQVSTWASTSGLFCISGDTTEKFIQQEISCYNLEKQTKQQTRLEKNLW